MEKLNIDIAMLPWAERILGLTLPDMRLMYVCTGVEVFRINLGEIISFEILNNNPYEFLNSQSHYLGVNGNRPILRQNDNCITYNFNPTADIVRVKYNIFGEIGKINFEILSGDWFAASFSTCSNYLVLAEPYDFHLYQIR